MLALCLAFALAACGEGGGDSGSDSKTAEPSEQTEGSGCEFDFPRTGFGFDLPEGMEITKGYLFPYDIGEVEYQCGIMEAWPVYVDMTKEEYDALTEEDAGRLHSSFSFQIICVKDAANADEAREKCLAQMKKENEYLSQAE